MFWEICHDCDGTIISSPYERDFRKEMKYEDSLCIYDINYPRSEWFSYGLVWIYERIQWCRENKILICDVVRQDYVHPYETQRRKRVYEFRFNQEEDAVAFKLRWM